MQFHSAAPSAPPSPPVVFGTTHKSLSLNWQAPPFEDTNGAIQNYVMDAILKLGLGTELANN